MPREIVPGVRDLIPPEGRITVEVRDERTGKLKQRLRGENAHMDWYMNHLKKSLTFPTLTYSTNTALSRSLAAPFYVGPIAEQAGQAAATGVRRAAEFFGTGVTGGLASLQWLTVFGNLWLSDNTAAISPSDRHIPGEIIGAAASYSDTNIGNTRLGQSVLSLMEFGSSTFKYVAEFGTTKGNGTFQTVGLGSIQGDVLASGNTNLVLKVMPCAYSTGDIIAAGDFGFANNSVMVASGVLPATTSANGMAWALGGTFFYQKGQTTGSLLAYPRSVGFPTTNPAATYTVTNANLGTPTSNAHGIAVQGGLLWVISGTNAWRNYVDPIASNTPSVNASGTFTGFTDTGVIDICTDGTSIYILGQTKVFVFDPTTQTITSSWTHGVSELASANSTSGSIEWSHAESNLWVTSSSTASTAGVYTIGWASASSMRVFPVHRFSAAGSPLGSQHIQASTSTAVNAGCGLLHLPNSEYALISFSGSGSNNHPTPALAATMRSAVLLNNPVTKTSSDTMTVAYEMVFS